MDSDFKKVDIYEYIKNGLENRSLTPFSAEKTGKVLAAQGQVGDEVKTWIVDDNGDELIEKVAKVELDNETNLPGWIVTKADMYGEAIIDKNGHYNQCIISDSTFKQKYEPDSNNDMLYLPKSNIQLFVKIHDNIILEQFGEEMKLAKGGYVNITNDNDLYAISEKDFEDTYVRSDEINRDEEVHEQKIYH